ncbi:zinc finger CCCH domain-containing protein 3 isoform X2 [Calliopsis andreniformis]|uniref:zinc finger CCCH domain-containing protein 3 isoform X2 n=1 Tax=Calliopsis andreniformis TaxID=337506 RepID=UPI003FCC32F6
MNENLLKEINCLTHLIQHRKMKSSEKSYCMEKHLLDPYLNITKFSKFSDVSNTNNTLTSTNVYINPNFKPQTFAIHINPTLCKKPLVHVNPKIMKNIIDSKEDVGNNSVHRTTNKNFVQDRNSLKTSVYVNPKLMKKLSASAQSKPTEEKQLIVQNITQPVCSRLKFIKCTNSSKVTHTQTKSSNSNIVILSQRKLVRVKRGLRRSSSTSQIELYKIKKSPNTLKNMKSVRQRTMKTKIVNATQQSVDKDFSFLKSPIMKSKINKYRIDRTVTGTGNSKKQISTHKKKNVYNKTELITIGGIIYKSSRNQLVRKSYGLIRKRATNTKSDKFIIATNGKKLCRVKPVKNSQENSSIKTSNVASGTKLLSSTFQKTTYKNIISNKVKQRSIQILRNKMQKNNQPCLIFQRFGYCSNHERGVCPKRHDKKQISLCKKFLQGNCLLDKCPLSHDVGPEKMPTCKYFLEGCCTRDGCPYRHIKVSSKTPICIEFLQGYCARGHECKQRHENLCPEFEKTEKCSKGKHCPYPHKLHSSPEKQNHLKRQKDVGNNPVVVPISKDNSAINENRLRYYEQSNNLNKNLDKKRESITRQIKYMRRLEAAIHSDTSIEKSDDNTNVKIHGDNCKSLITADSKTLKRPPIGSLPAYIPID